MHILLINNNPVVSRLISLCIREKKITLEEVERIGSVLRDKYDVVFVNESSYGVETKEALSNLIISKKVLLSNEHYSIKQGSFFDMAIQKPFLPSQISAVLESLDGSETTEGSGDATPTDSFIFPLASEEGQEEHIDTESQNDEMIDLKISESEDGENKETDLSIFESIEEEATGTNILDSNEIDKIKTLLEMEEEISDETKELSGETYEDRKIEVIKEHLIADGLELVNEDEYVESLSTKPKKSKSKKKKKKKKKKSVETFTFEEALLAAVEGMKVKKIKKLLRGAEVNLKINFKDKK